MQIKLVISSKRHGVWLSNSPFALRSKLVGVWIQALFDHHILVESNRMHT